MNTIISRKTAYSVLVLLAAAALLFSAVGITEAYFTTFVTAHGRLTLNLETEITIYEEFQNVDKLITINNTGECDCWVRIKVISPEGITINWPADGSWAQKNPDDGYWYYTSLLPVGSSTKQFYAGIPENPIIDGQKPQEFNIAVIAESIPGSEGMTWDQADWSLLAKEAEK